MEGVVTGLARVQGLVIPKASGSTLGFGVWHFGLPWIFFRMLFPSECRCSKNTKKNRMFV